MVEHVSHARAPPGSDYSTCGGFEVAKIEIVSPSFPHERRTLALGRARGCPYCNAVSHAWTPGSALPRYPGWIHASQIEACPGYP